MSNVREFRTLVPFQLANIFFQNDQNVATHHASWYKSCHLKYNNSKLAKVKKRTINNADNLEKRPPRKCQALEIYSCLFCEKGHEKDRVSLFDADSNIRTMITELQDIQLLARIQISLQKKRRTYHFNGPNLKDQENMNHRLLSVKPFSIN